MTHLFNLKDRVTVFDERGSKRLLSTQGFLFDLKKQGRFAITDKL